MATDLLVDEERDHEILPVRLPDRYEVIDGRIVELPDMSALALETANLLLESMIVHLRQNPIGRSRMEMTFPLTLVNGSVRSRRPDVAYVSFERWPRDRPLPTRGNDWPVLPELAVEVVSPNDLIDEFEEKMAEYFEAGILQVWLINPIRQTITVFESFIENRRLRRDQTLDGIPFLPGFSLPLTELFPLVQS